MLRRRGLGRGRIDSGHHVDEHKRPFHRYIAIESNDLCSRLARPVIRSECFRYLSIEEYVQEYLYFGGHAAGIIDLMIRLPAISHI